MALNTVSSSSSRLEWLFIWCCFFFPVVVTVSFTFSAFHNPHQPLFVSKRNTRNFSRNEVIVHASSSGDNSIWSRDELKEYALSQGVNITFSTLGPGYRAVARSTHDSSQIMGYCEGFVRPTGNVLHLDKMEVFRPAILNIQNENPKFVKGGTIFGPGLLLGFVCLLHGRDKGCTVGEFLAIDDEEKQHQKLVRYYQRIGFEIIKYVGDDFADIPDRMVWGGCGTLMRQDIDTLLNDWTARLERAKKEQAKTKTE